MRSALTHIAVVTLSLLGLASACDDDARVLWQETTTDAPTTGSASGPGETVSTTATGPPPLPPYCGQEPVEDPNAPCVCAPEEPCMCGFFEEPFSDEPCSMLCDGEGCHFFCAGPQPCEAECSSGCDLQCEPGSTCSLLCEGDCTLICEQDAVCHLWSWNGLSQMVCPQGSICICEIEENCECIGAGCP